MRFKNAGYSIYSIIVLLALSGIAMAEPASNDALWREVKGMSVATTRQMPVVPASYRTLSLRQAALTELLARAPMEFSEKAKTTELVITLPMPEGGFARFRVEESPMLSPEVAATVPDWKTYSGRGIDDPTSVVRLSWSKEGLKAAVLRNEGMFYVDPMSANDVTSYICYAKSALKNERAGFHCKIEEYLSRKPESLPKTGTRDGAATQNISHGNKFLKTYSGRRSRRPVNTFGGPRRGQDADALPM